MKFSFAFKFGFLSLTFCLLVPTLLRAADVKDFGGRPIQFNKGVSAVSARASSDEPVFGEAHIVSTVGTAATNNINLNVGAEAFYNAGITGQDSSAANVEAGHIWGNPGGHETLEHVTNFVHHPTLTYNDTSNSLTKQEDLVDRHATWVGGNIGGQLGGAVQGERQRGIAPDTNLQSGAIALEWSGSAFSGSFSFFFTAMDASYRDFFGTTDVINSSWGALNATTTGGVDGRASIVDGRADQNPTTTFVSSAGNSGASGTNTVGSPGSGYNGITVGALANASPSSNVYNTVAPFSSRGAQDFTDPTGTNSCLTCRAAVDIVAPGTNLTAAYYGGATGGNNTGIGGPSGPTGTSASYTNGVQGTSFSSPIVAGGAALLYSASRNLGALPSIDESRDARVIKAVLMNSADKIPGWNNSQVVNAGVIETTQALDLASGAGALNLEQAFEQYVNADTQSVAGTPFGSQGAVGAVGFDYGEVSADAANTYLISQPLESGSTMTVTLAWFRDRTTDVTETQAVTTLDNAQADLDLIIRNATTNQIVARSISAVNVVEHLSFVVPTEDIFQIEVEYPRNVFGSISTEQYGLAWHAVAVPEPSPVLALGLLMVGMGAVRRLKPRRKA